MGASEDDIYADPDEKPQHEITLDGFWIDQYEVTNSEYAACVRAGSCKKPQEYDYNGFPYSFAKEVEEAPVVNVSWNDANAYCTWAGKNLPTEAEWEKAARGIDGRMYPWGNDDDPFRKAWYCFSCIFIEGFPDLRDDFSRPASVGSFPEGISPYGAQDMAGNALEWVLDWYNGYFYAQSGQVNPTGPKIGTYRVVRGGSWTSPPERLRTTYRQWCSPLTTWIDVGFRCVMEDNRSQLIAPDHPTETLIPSKTPIPTHPGPSPTPSHTHPPTTVTAIPEKLPIYALVYADTQGIIHVAKSDGSQDTPITDRSNFFFSPAWAPAENSLASDTIAMFGNGDEGPAIFTIAPDGSTLRKLLEIELPGNTILHWIGNLQWAPDRERFLFQTFWERGVYQMPNVHTLAASGGDMSTIAKADYPVFSPTGGQVAYTRYAETDKVTWLVKNDVYLQDEIELVLANYRIRYLIMQSDWSPRGDQIVYASNASGNFNLVVKDLEKDTTYSLTREETDEYIPAWSPSGDEIAFLSASDICAIQANGANRRVILPGFGFNVYSIEWSPDGTRLAITMENEAGVQLFVVNADGSRLVQISANLTYDYAGVPYGGFSNARPSWSPQPVGP